MFVIEEKTAVGGVDLRDCLTFWNTVLLDMYIDFFAIVCSRRQLNFMYDL